MRLICRAWVTATSSVRGVLTKFDEQLGTRRFSFSTSLSSDIEGLGVARRYFQK